MTRQFCTRAHTENALAMGPKVPYTKSEHDVGGTLYDGGFKEQSLTASRGKAVEANHQRLSSSISIPIWPHCIHRSVNNAEDNIPWIEKCLLILCLELLFVFDLSLHLFCICVNRVIQSRIVHFGLDC